ncbi:MAG: alpha/beta hydrolase [Actinophytocola sp.]|nr:alpha/beta hydrolase [Actinophytocola sp.]
MGDERVSRRTMLTAGVAGLALTGGVLTPLLGASGGGGAASASYLSLRSVERVRSRARRRDVDLVTMLPGDDVPDTLPVCLVLHGLGGDAVGTQKYGFNARLVSEAAMGTIPPFALVAVDGGDNYWNQVRPHDDPMAMLLNELPVWLRERGLADPPFACAGVSMGGFGALLYARMRAERHDPLRATAAVSPALITSWSVMRTRRIFPSREAWESLDPLRHPDATDPSALGVWCGKDDQFVTGTRQFISMTQPNVVYLGPGGHTANFVSGVADEVVRFLGRHAP